jgi:hypothetical protein
MDYYLGAVGHYHYAIPCLHYLLQQPLQHQQLSCNTSAPDVF